MGAAVVGRLYKPGWKDRAETRIFNSRVRCGHDSTAGLKSSRRAASPVKSRKGDTVFRDFIPGVLGQVFRPELLSDTKAFHTATLSPHTRKTPFTCFWRFSSLRHRDARTAAVCTAENGRWPGLGMRRSLSQPHVEDLRNRQEMGILCRRQSRNRGRASGKESSSGKARAFARANTSAFGCARRARPHDGFTRSADRVENWRDVGFALERCRFQLRRNSSRAGLLPGSDRHTQDQRQPPYASDAEITPGRAKASWQEIRIGRASGFSNPQWHPVQRHQPATQVPETGRTEARNALAQLAHSTQNSRHAFTARG